MYHCEMCGGDFYRFKTPGQCPLCKLYALVRCLGCQYIADATVFINNNDHCPKCGASVTVPGSSALGVPEPVAAIGCLGLLVLVGIGVWFEEYGKDLQWAPASVNPVSAPAPQEPLESQLAPADLLLAEAGKLWDEGKWEASIATAENALALYRRVLGDESTKAADVREMIESAKAQMRTGADSQ